MSGTPMRTRPRGNTESVPRIDRLIGGERWLRDIRRAREYRDASGYALLAYRSELSAGIALETAHAGIKPTHSASSGGGSPFG